MSAEEKGPDEGELSPAEAQAEKARKYDLTLKHLCFLDKHLGNHLLQHLRQLNSSSDVDIFPTRDVIRAQYELMSQTKMTHYMYELKREIDGETDQDVIDAEVAEVTSQFKRFIEGTEEVIEFLQSSEATELRDNNLLNMNTLKEGNNDLVYQISHFFFERLNFGNGGQPDLPFLETPQQNREARVVMVPSPGGAPVPFTKTQNRDGWSPGSLLLASEKRVIAEQNGDSIEYNGIEYEQFWIRVEASSKRGPGDDKIEGWMPSVVWAWILDDGSAVLQFEEGARWDWTETDEARRGWKVGDVLSISSQFLGHEDRRWVNDFSEQDAPYNSRSRRPVADPQPFKIKKIRRPQRSHDSMEDMLTIGTEKGNFNFECPRHDPRIRSVAGPWNPDTPEKRGPGATIQVKVNKYGGRRRGDNDVFEDHVITEEHAIPFLTNYPVPSMARDKAEQLYEFARFWYEAGQYEDFTKLLEYYKDLMRDVPEAQTRCFKAMWGELAAHILGRRLPEALECAENIELAIEDKEKAIYDGEQWDPQEMKMVPKHLFNATGAVNEIQMETEKAWLLHWTLFIYFNLEDNEYKKFIEFFKRKLNTVQVLCPHLLRYYTVAVVINEVFASQSPLFYMSTAPGITGANKNIIQLANILEQEKNNYSDPITEIVRLLIVEHNFEGASRALLESIDVHKNDFFLAYNSDMFMSCARQLFFMKYCRLHNKISLTQLADLIGLEQSKAEDWVVNFIRKNPVIKARVDVIEEIIYVTQPVTVSHGIVQYSTSIYKEVMEKLHDVLRPSPDGRNNSSLGAYIQRSTKTKGYDRRY